VPPLDPEHLFSPSLHVSRSDAVALVARAQSAFTRFNAAPADDRRAFLTLLLFQPRKT
jgi:hypothetical protein